MATMTSMIKTLGHRILREVRRPVVHGNTQMLGSFPPYAELCTIGSRQNYFIHDGYEHRLAPQYFDDTANSDGWQDEVYLFAREIADKYDLRSILDIGWQRGRFEVRY